MATEKVKEIVSLKEIEWKKHKINRSLDYLDILKEIKDILKLRHEEYYDVETVIRYMGCKNTLKENLTSVERFKQGIIEIIPDLCDAIDSLNYEMAGEIGLSGEIRPVNRIEQRIGEAEKLGFKRFLLPKYNLQGIDTQKLKIELVPVRKVEEAFRALFG